MPSQIVRILCEARSASRTVRDTATGERPFLWRGSSVTFQLGLTDNGQHLLRPGVGTIIVEVKRLDATSADASLMRKEFVQSDCDATFAAGDWDGGSKQLLAAPFTIAESALLPGIYRLIVRHEGLDGSALTHLSAEFAVIDPQSGSEGIDAPPVAWSYLEALPVVRTDIPQSLSEPQKLQARQNIGAGDGTTSVTPASLLTAAQAMTPTQEADMRRAIGDRLADINNTQRFVAAKSRQWGITVGPQTDPVRIVVAGDSLSTGLEPLENMGVTGFFSQASFTTAGTAATNPLSEDWIAGRILSIPVGSTVQFHHAGGVDASYQCSKIAIGYIADPGAGSFQIQTSTPQRSSGAWENVGVIQNTENATKIGVWYEVDVPTTSTAPLYRVRITNVTGKPLRIACWGVWNHQSWGVVWMSGVANLTGQDVVNWASTTNDIFNPIWTGLRPDCVISRWADAGSNWAPGGAWRTQYARMKAARPECDFIQLSGGPDYNGTDSGVAWPTYYGGQTQYRVGDVAIAQNDTTKLWGRYVCTVAHTQQADRKPGQGASWQSFWAPFVYDPAITASSAAASEEQAKQQELWAAEAGETFLDLRDVFGHYQAAFANGLIGDFVHPTGAGWESMLAALNRRLSLAKIPLGGMGFSGLFALSVSPGSQYVRLDRPFEIGSIPSFGGAPALRINASDAGNDSRKFVQIDSSSATAFFRVDGVAVFDGSLNANGAGQHALRPSNSAYSLGVPGTRWRAWLGGVSSGTRTITGATTLAGASDHTVYCNATSGAFTVTLPTASAVPGQLFVIKKIDSSSNAVTIAGTVDGTTNPTLTAQWQVLRVRSDGTNYYAE